MNENPYAAPAVAPENPSAPVDVSTREIRTVSRVLRWLGWTIMVLYAPMSVATLFTAVCYLLIGETTRFWEMVPISVTCCGAFYLGWTYLRVGKGLLAKRPRAYRAAMLLLCLLLIGFPLFTLIGGICIYKLRKYYAEYLALPEPAEPNS